MTCPGSFSMIRLSGGSGETDRGGFVFAAVRTDAVDLLEGQQYVHPDPHAALHRSVICNQRYGKNIMLT